MVIHNMKVYSLFLSTNTTLGKYAPTDKTNLANVRWNINWREIFGNRQGECRVRCRFISASSTGALTWAANVGSLRATFASNSSNSTNGFNIASVRPQNDSTGTNFTYLDSDTTTAVGTSMIIPNTSGDFSIFLLNSNETPMVNVPNYQIWLYFDVDDEEPYYKGDSTNNLPSIYNPR